MKKNQIVNEAAKVLLSGGVVLSPTDTIWGLHADATNENAIEKIIRLKKRATNKSFIILVSSKKMLKQYLPNFTNEQEVFLKNQKQATTLIYPKVLHLPSMVLANNKSCAIRIVKQSICLNIIKTLNKPLVSTSANISGQKSSIAFTDIPKNIIQNVDFCIPPEYDEKNHTNASQIYKVEKNYFIKIR